MFPCAGIWDVKSRYLVDCVLQTLASLELGLVGSCNLDGFSGARVAPRRSFAMRNAEGAKTNKTDFLFAGKSSGNGIKNTVYGFGRISFGKACVAGDGGNEIVFIQGINPPLVFESMKTVLVSLKAGFRTSLKNRLHND